MSKGNTKISFLQIILVSLSISYEPFKKFAKTWFPVYTVILAILYTLSHFFYNGIIGTLLNLSTGYSIVFIFYLLGGIILLDKRIDVKIEEHNRLFKDTEKIPAIPHNYRWKYRLTIIYTMVLITAGIACTYYTNRYTKIYNFKSQIFAADIQNRTFHIENYIDECDIYIEDCDNIGNSIQTKAMKGFELVDSNYTFCPTCKEWAEEDMNEYIVSKY